VDERVPARKQESSLAGSERAWRLAQAAAQKAKESQPLFVPRREVQDVQQQEQSSDEKASTCAQVANMEQQSSAVSSNSSNSQSSHNAEQCAHAPQEPIFVAPQQQSMEPTDNGTATAARRNLNGGQGSHKTWQCRCMPAADGHQHGCSEPEQDSMLDDH